jgi:hypothetical protein
MTQLIGLTVLLTTAVNPLKVTVDGDGYLRFLKAGRVVYAKSASLTEIDGALGYDGAKLMPSVEVPAGAKNLSIDLSGNITAAVPGGRSRIGKLVLAIFPATESGQKQGAFLTFADRPSLADPGDDLAGVIRAQNAPKVESSTVAANPKPAPEAAKSDGPQQIEVVVHQHTELSSNSFTMGDIATVVGPAASIEKLEAIKIGDNVLPAVSRTVDPAYITLRLRGAGFQPGEYVLVVPPGADVVRKSKTITPDDLLNAAIQAVKGTSTIPMTFRAKDAITGITCADGDVTIEPSSPEETPGGYVVNVAVRQGATIVGVRTVTLVPDGAVACVKAGDPVSVIVKAGAATVQVQGHVLTSAFIGQRVQVSIAGVGNKTTTHLGTLVEGGKVEVDL